MRSTFATCTALVAVLLTAACSSAGAHDPGATTSSVSARRSSTLSPAQRSSAAAARASSYPVALTTSPRPTVGPLFPDGLSKNHSCTASVVASSSGDTVLTAAHCLGGNVAGWLFVPAYDKGATPYGAWTVTGEFQPAQWISTQEPRYDYAILTVANRTIDGRSRTLQSVVGAEQLGIHPDRRELITDVAYNDGIRDSPIECTTTVVLRGSSPTFHCHGFVGGSSGSPWLTGSGTDLTVVGVIGGRKQGGCEEYTSHSALFTTAVSDLLTAAEHGGGATTAPSVAGPNC